VNIQAKSTYKVHLKEFSQLDHKTTIQQKQWVKEAPNKSNFCFRLTLIVVKSGLHLNMVSISVSVDFVHEKMGVPKIKTQDLRSKT